ncbi:MAG: HPr(Ser) kinase/phosphatase [Lactobacillaceae bacterium]|jgi:HPr kinase/phosphorylase|nr:HPr(Ser) kinase/phosphatase [Lactobacillaceae bacterium]
MANVVSVKELVENTKLSVLYGDQYLDRIITVPDIARPGLTLTGFFEYFEPRRVQLFGVNEINFSSTLTSERRTEIFTKMATSETPAFVISTHLHVPQELLEVAKEAKIPVLTSSLTSSRLLSNMTYYLGSELSQRVSVHGVLIDINGIGVLLTGDPGVGKTETALELIQQGKARLVADDRVDVYAEDEQHLIGRSSEVLTNLMEIRGVGIIDLMQTYGAAVIRDHATIVLNIDLKNAEKDFNEFDRLGNGEQSIEILGIKIPKMMIPVSSGRNTASVVDAAVLKYRTDAMGLNALDTLMERQSKLMEQNEKNDK